MRETIFINVSSIPHLILGAIMIVRRYTTQQRVGVESHRERVRVQIQFESTNVFKSAIGIEIIKKRHETS